MARQRELNVELSVLTRRQGNQYSSWCPELDVASCGETVEEACENLNDAIDAYLSALAEEGNELLLVLSERGLVNPDTKEPETCEKIFFSHTSRPLPYPME